MDVRTADEVAALAWPALRVERRDGWWYRWADGYTDRANSAAVLEAGSDPEASMAWVRRRAAEDGIRPQLQVSDRADLAPIRDRLAGRPSHSPTWIMVGAPDPAVTDRIDVDATVTEAWFAAWWDMNRPAGDRAAVGAFYTGLAGRLDGGRVLACSAAIDGDTVAVGLGVVMSGATYVCSMTTAPSARRTGLATAIVRTIAAGGEGPLFLQVGEDNEGAIAAYHRLGFERIGSYRYWVL